MIRRLIAAAAAATALAGGLLIGAQPAFADSLTTTGYYTDTLNHGGNPALGSVKFEAWIIQYRNVSGVVIGTVGRTRMTDLGGNVAALQVNSSALRWRNNNVIVQNNNVITNQQTPGTGLAVQADTNDSIGDGAHWWADTHQNATFSGILGLDSVVSVRWGDGQLGTYRLGALDSSWYGCSTYDSQTACGSNSYPLGA